MLASKDISAEVVHISTIKPLDEEVILNSAGKTRHVLTAEEAQIAGGLGGAVAELLGEKMPTAMLRIGMKDRFGESGEPEELLKHFELDAEAIAKAARKLLTDHTNHAH